MSRAKLAVLAPVVFVLLLLLKVEARTASSSENNVVQTIVSTKTVNTKTVNTANTTLATKIRSTVFTGNVSTTNPSTMTTAHTYFAPHFGGMAKRLVYVTLVLSAVIGLYFLVKFCRNGRRKPRKYGVIKTPGDMEMRPLESDDEGDEDVTMFNRKD